MLHLCSISSATDIYYHLLLKSIISYGLNTQGFFVSIRDFYAHFSQYLYQKLFRPLHYNTTFLTSPCRMIFSIFGIFTRGTERDKKNCVFFIAIWAIFSWKYKVSFVVLHLRRSCK